MALPDPAGDPPNNEEQGRRFAILKTYMVAFLGAGLVGIPGWLHGDRPSLFSLSASLVPAAVASCLLIALTVSLPVLHPVPKLMPLQAVTNAAMHVMVMTAFATALTVRSSALMSLPPQMEILARWGTFRLAGSAFLVEAGLLFIYSVASSAFRRSPPSGDA